MKNIKNFLFAAIWMCLFLLGSSPIFAGELSGEAPYWTLRSLNFSHTQVSFELSGVERAQKATAVITSMDEEDDFEVSIDFRIKSAIESFELELPEDTFLLAEKEYQLTIYDQYGGEISDSEYLNKCLVQVNRIGAFPNQIEAVIGEYSKVTKATAEVEFQEYEGTITDDNRIVIPYPRQEMGVKIEVTFSDEYGCEEKYTETVANKELNCPSVSVFPTAAMMYRDSLEFDERFGVKIGEEVYYSDYGCKQTDKWGAVVVYPTQKAGTVIEIWVENKAGCVSFTKEYSVIPCDLKDCSFDVTAYPAQLQGKVSANAKGQIPTKAAVVIGSKKYEAAVKSNGTFAISYPRQNDNAKINLQLLDAHGCSLSNQVAVKNDLSNSKYAVGNNIYVDDISLSSITGKSIAGARLCVQIGSKIYYSAYGKNTAGYNSTLKVTYPKQKAGTKVKVWYEMQNTSKTQTIDIPIPQRFLDIYIRKMTATNALIFLGDGYIKFNGKLYDSELYIDKMYVTVNGKKSAEVKIGSFSGEVDEYDMDDYEDDDDDDYDFEDDEYYYYIEDDEGDKIKGHRIDFSAKVGDTVQFVLTDKDGYIYTYSKKVPNIEPDIYIDNVDTSSKKISGETSSGASVTIKVGKKKFTTKAGKKGNFSIKIKPQKPGTKITVSVKTKEGYTGKETFKIKKPKGSIDLTKYVYRDSTSLSCKITNASKGDKIIVKIGSKTFTKKITSNKKKQNVKISIKPESAGQKITLTFYDKYKNKKGSATSMVYIGKTIYVGMSISDVVLTTWGKPVRKNSYGGMLQWIFKDSYSTLYVYIENGVVTSLQRYNY